MNVEINYNHEKIYRVGCLGLSQSSTGGHLVSQRDRNLVRVKKKKNTEGTVNQFTFALATVSNQFHWCSFLLFQHSSRLLINLQLIILLDGLG